MGIDLSTFTFIHTAMSLLGLITGVILLFGLAVGRDQGGLATTTIVLLVLTSATGFGFPFTKILPSHIVSIISLVVLAIVCWARYLHGLAGAARVVHGIGLTAAVYFDAFVAVVQSFLKIPALTALAPTQQSPGFMIVQLILLIAFVVLGFKVVRGQRRDPSRY